jgi:oxygen-independent coproporphyrinogen-3 oxidase
VRKRIPAERYAACILTELELRRARGDWDEEPTETLYFGGGTPSLLAAESLALLIERLSPRRHEAEVTVEANPEDVTAGAAHAWATAGVTRVSLGAQSFTPSVLRWMHRTHEVPSIAGAVEHLRTAGIEDISLDVIFGLPTELHADLPRDLHAALQLEPDHVSAYGLSVEPRTPLARWVSRGATAPAPEARYAREFLLVHEILSAAGFEHYEVSNYARPGHRSVHNSMYWTGRAFAGLGPAAHSFQGGVRSWNLSAWAAYERALAAQADPTAERERLTELQRAIERIYLGLRTAEGLERTYWRANPDFEQKWQGEGWVEVGPDRFRLTPTGWLRLDEIAVLLTTSADSG